MQNLDGLSDVDNLFGDSLNNSSQGNNLSSDDWPLRCWSGCVLSSQDSDFLLDDSDLFA